MTDDERRRLLAIARESLVSLLEHREAHDPGPLTGRLAEPGGAFVTLRSGGRLRGCIGYIDSPQPLANVVAELARKSAREDPRFPPLSPPEMTRVSLEVSVLSAIRPLADASGIRPGVDGLLLELRGRRGLLLPQVATEQGWDAEGLLRGTCCKAGLPPGAWKDPEARMFTFTAEICDESERRS
ncbi:MAG TPA: AmmeMemoRadiSam system protein A [Bacteroidota bacterium]|nr:AmmeMemoRadiSam system protein A [Bacteroidota bacterium]